MVEKPRYKTEEDLLNVIEDLLDEHGPNVGFVAVSRTRDNDLVIYSDFGPSFYVWANEVHEIDADLEPQT